MDYALMIC